MTAKSNPAASAWATSATSCFGPACSHIIVYPINIGGPPPSPRRAPMRDRGDRTRRRHGERYPPGGPGPTPTRADEARPAAHSDLRLRGCRSRRASKLKRCPMNARARARRQTPRAGEEHVNVAGRNAATHDRVAPEFLGGIEGIVAFLEHPVRIALVGRVPGRDARR